MPNLPPEIDDNVTARPLQMPDFEHFEPVDPTMTFRLVNFKVGDKESGLRFSQMHSAGYIPAEAKDVKNLDPARVSADGKIIIGDVILCKIKKSLEDGAKKFNWQRAQRRVGKLALDKAQLDLQNTGAPKSQLSKISVFAPDKGQLDALVGTDKDVKP
jgi:hypothetical protein